VIMVNYLDVATESAYSSLRKAGYFIHHKPVVTKALLEGVKSMWVNFNKLDASTFPPLDTPVLAYVGEGNLRTLKFVCVGKRDEWMAFIDKDGTSVKLDNVIRWMPQDLFNL